MFELFRFATFSEKLLIILGSLAAIIEGSGPPAMALVFGGMTNTLVDLVKFGFAPNSEIDSVNGTLSPVNSSLAPSSPINSSTPLEFESKMQIYSLYYVFIGIAIYISSLIQISCWQVSCEKQIQRIRLSFFRSILRQELSWFDKNQSGELSAKFNDDIDRIRDGIGDQFSSLIKYLSSFLTAFFVGFVVSWRLTLVILCATPLLAAFSAYLGKMLSTTTKREQEKYASAGAVAEEVLVAVRTVFSLNGQRQEIKNYKTKLMEGKKMAQWKYLKLGLGLGASMFVLYSTYGLALYVSSNLLAVDLITAGSAMTVIMAVMMGASALGQMLPPLQTIAMSVSSAGLIFEIIDSIPRIDATNDRGLKLSKVTANIKFENVSFSYPLRPAVQVLKNLNFELNQGQTIAICGRTGSGKSTIINLLLRFYDPSEGSVYLDNCNLRDLNVAWLRSLAGIVEQEPALFDCSIYENIALGARQDSDNKFERIIEASKLANAHEFITSLPEGYNTRCGDRGVQMSGGQKQRIAIARALLCDPKILLLDEATSALDSESEFMVQSALNKARQGRTTVVIAHRLSTIRGADLICVMDKGKIVEMGRHDELMGVKGQYYELVTNQVFSEDSNGGNGHDGQGSAGSVKTAGAWHQILSEESKEFQKSSVQTSLNSFQVDYKPFLKSAGILEGEQEAEEVRMGDILNLVRPEWTMYFVASIVTVLSGALLPAFALLYAQIFDTFSKTGDELLESGYFWSLMFVVLAALFFLTMSTRVYLMASTIENSLARIRSECFENIMRQPVEWFDLPENSPQRITTRLATDVPKIKAVLNSRVVNFISGLATILAAIIIAFYLGWKLAILLTLALPLLIYVGYLQMLISRGNKGQQLKQMENASRMATEAVEHVKLIQAINQERYFFDKFHQELRHSYRSSLKSARRFGLIYGLSQSFIFFVYAASFRYGAHLIANGELHPITVFRVFFSIAFTSVVVGQWGGVGGDMSVAYHAMGLIIKLLGNRPSIDNLSSGGIMPRLKGLVTFQDIHFNYAGRPETPVLRGLSLSVEPGQTVALVGSSGQGKSTVAALLLRFYDPNSGVVRIDHHDIRCINLNYLRTSVGLVSQEPCLFKASIKDNILYGLSRKRYTMKDVVKATKLANIHDFIESLPEKYETQVGERGTQMSGGQKQRIAIARTIIRNPTILILDEATSALDAESEALVNQALEKAAAGKTCIKIAHRLSTVRDANKIAVVDKGTIVELGTHDELMSMGKKGHYFKLMQKQDISS